MIILSTHFYINGKESFIKDRMIKVMKILKGLIDELMKDNTLYSFIHFLFNLNFILLILLLLFEETWVFWRASGKEPDVLNQKSSHTWLRMTIYLLWNNSGSVHNLDKGLGYVCDDHTWRNFLMTRFDLE